MPADSGFYVQPLGMSYKGNNMITCLVVNPDRKIFNPYAAGGLFGQYKMMRKKRMTGTLADGYSSESTQR